MLERYSNGHSDVCEFVYDDLTWTCLRSLRLDLRLDKTVIQTNTELRKRQDHVHNKFGEVNCESHRAVKTFHLESFSFCCSAVMLEVEFWISFGTIQQLLFSVWWSVVNILELWLWHKDDKIFGVKSLQDGSGTRCVSHVIFVYKLRSVCVWSVWTEMSQMNKVKFSTLVQKEITESVFSCREAGKRRRRWRDG